MKSRNFVFTIPNPTKKMLKDLENVAITLEKHNYIIYALEKGEKTGLEHIQGYVQLRQNRNGLPFLHNYFNLKKRKKLVKFHLEPARGSGEDNQKYIRKAPIQLWEFGEMKEQGKRSDLLEIKKALYENPREIQNLVRESVGNYQQLQFLRSLLPFVFSPRFVDSPPVVIWLYGKSGVGKTRFVYDNFRDICSVSNYKWLGTGYYQQEVFLFDDFRKYNLNFNHLLKLLDRYPIEVFFKGGSIPFNSSYIFITAPESPEDMYHGEFDDVEQLLRRLSLVVNMENDEEVEKLKKFLAKKRKNDKV